MKKFSNQKGIEKYIVKKFSSESSLILIRGSTAKKRASAFSDFDIEVYGRKIGKPNYEIVMLGKYPVLISSYFYKYVKGDEGKEPRGVKILSGKFNDMIKPNFSQDKYNTKERIRRECQMVVDFMFKYLRSKNTENLKSVQKRI